MNHSKAIYRYSVLIALLVLTPLLFAQDYYSSQFLVCFKKEIGQIHPAMKNGIVKTGYRSFDALSRDYHITGMERWLTSAGEEDIIEDVNLANIYRLHFSGPQSVEEAVAAFSRNEWLHSAEYEPVIHPEVFLNPYTPNDPAMTNQWYTYKIMADWAWGVWTAFGEIPGDSTIVIGIVDSGVEWDHPDLMANIWVNPGEDIDGDGVVGDFGSPANGGDEDGLDNDNNGKTDDLIGWDFVGYDNNNPQEDNNPMATAMDHGTNVSGCASAVTDNGIGITGIGYRVKLLLSKHGADNGYQYLVNAYDGLLYAAKTGADVINCSWGSYSYSGYAQSVVTQAHDTYGAIIVGAAGNDNINLNNNHHYPSDYANVIGVAGTDQDDSKSGGSNYGNPVDISAPYSSIYTTGFTSGGGYQVTQGTSLSAPIVSGSIGLLKSMYPDSSQAWLEDRILAAADNIDAQNPNYIGWLGSGRVNAFNAVAQPMFPNIVYNNQAIQILNDDGNGLLNPGEGARLRVTLKNLENWQDVDNLTAVLHTDHPLIHITDSTANFGPVNNGSVVINIADPFEFQVDSLAPNGDYNFTLSIEATAGTNPLYEKSIPLVINVSGYQTGWPVGNVAYIQSSPLVLNSDASPELEIFAGSNGGNFWGWNYDGSVISNYPLSLGGQMWGSPAFGDIDNDGTEEIVIGTSQGHLFVISTQGIIQQNWNIGEFIYGTVSLADLDDNNDLEIIFGTFSGNLQVLNHDGSNFGNFPFNMGATERVIGGCAVADINGDNNLEIIAGTQAGNIYAMDTQANVLPGFPYSTGSSIIGSAVAADLDGSGPNGVRILTGAQDGVLYVLKSDGTPDFTFDTGTTIRSTPGLCDIDGNGNLEIFVGNNNTQVYGLNRNGSQLSGFPISIGGNIESQPVFADLDGNGAPEMIITSLDGVVYAYDFTASGWAAGFPSPISGQIKSTPTIADIDLDNDLEIAFGTNNSFAVLDIRQQNGTADNYWHTFQANFRRTGYYGDAVVGITSKPPNAPLTFRLMQNYPNPFNPQTTIKYSLPEPGHTRLEIFNILGEKVATLVDEQQKTGVYSIQWNADECASGLYFYRITSGQYTALRRMLFLK